MSLGALKSDIRKIAGWAAALPAIVTWPFVSAFPIIALTSKSAAYPGWSINAAFAATGMWGVLTLLLAGRLVQRTTAHEETPSIVRGRGVLITCYAYIWLIIYGVVTLWKF